MKKMRAISGIGILSLALLSFTGKDECEKSKEAYEAAMALTELQKPFIKELLAQFENEALSINDINFIEIEEEIDLAFKTTEYLPAGFDAHKGMGLDLSKIDLVEIEEEIDLGFDTAEYLHVGFNPDAGMELDLDEIDFIEPEEETDLGFDTSQYLPADFNPYKGMDYVSQITSEKQFGFKIETDSK